MLLILLIAIASTEKISAQIKEKQCRNDSSQSVFRARIMWQLKVHEKCSGYELHCPVSCADAQRRNQSEVQEDKILHFKDFMKVQQIGYLLKVAIQSTKYDFGRAFFFPFKTTIHPEGHEEINQLLWIKTILGKCSCEIAAKWF